MEENEEFDSDFSAKDIPMSTDFWNYMEDYWHHNRYFPESTESQLNKKADLVGGKVPSSQLPSYVDDVLEFNSFENLPGTGEKGKIYLTISNNAQFRWSGSEYIEINSPANAMTINTLQSVTGRKLFLSSGGSGYNNHTLRLYSNDGSNPGATFYKDGADASNIIFDGSDFKFINAANTGTKFISANGYKKSGSDDNYFLTGNGGHILRSTYATAVQADARYIPYTGAISDLSLGAKNLNFSSGAISKSINNNRIFNKVYQNHIQAAQTGILSFKVPQASTSATMFDVTLKIYGYQNRFLGTIRVSFYKFSATAINVNGNKALIECSDNFPSTIINVGVDGNGDIRINIGDATTVWNSYVTVEVDRLSVIHSGNNFDWSQGWFQTIETDTSAYQSILNIVPDVMASKSWVNTTLSNVFKQDYLKGRSVVAGEVTLLDSFLPNGGFIASYNSADWAGSGRPNGASYGGYVKFSAYSDNNNLDFYYNNGHGTTTNNRLWFRTKNAAGSTVWRELYHEGNLNLSTYQTVAQSFKILRFVTNLNEVTESGIYRQEGPTSGYSYTTTLNLNSSDGRQQLTIARNGSGMKFRGSINGSGDQGWSTWRTVWDDSNFNPTNYSLATHIHTFASLTSKPTTLSGYSISDAMSTSHAANGITNGNINNWNAVFGWGSHALAGYATADFVSQSVEKIITEHINPDYPVFAASKFNTIIITKEFTKEYLDLDSKLIPGRQITVINLAPFDIAVRKDDNVIDKIFSKETTEYYIMAEKRLLKKGSYKEASMLS